MEECARLCGLGSSRRCRCPQKRQRPAEMAVAEASGVFRSARAQLRRGRLRANRPGRKAPRGGRRSSVLCGEWRNREPHAAPALLITGPACGDAGGDLRLAPRTDLASLAQACTKFRHILRTDSVWRQRCREEFGVLENLQTPEMMGMSYREVYAKMFPYRNILGLWQLDYAYRRLLNVVVDGLGITGWTYRPSLNTHVDGPMQFEPCFRIRLTERKSASVEYMDNPYSFFHKRHMQIQKDKFSIRWIKRDHRKDSPTQLRGERGLVLLREDRQLHDSLTYRRLYLPPSHPDDLIRPGLFQGKYDGFGLMIAILSFHGKYARVTKITGDLIWTLEIHLVRRIHLPDGEIFRNFNELSRVVLEIEEQVIREQQQPQQQANGTEESESHGWQSPAQPSVRESWAAASEEQPVPFVLPVGMRSGPQNYPRTCRMCFYDVHMLTLHGFTDPRRCPGVFILFGLEAKYFILLGRVQNTFQNVEAPSPQAFLEMLSNIQSGPPGRSSLHAL